MKNYLFITLLMLSAVTLKAQNNNKTTAQPDSIIKLIPVGEGRHSGFLYTVGGRLQSPEDIRIRLLSYAPSATEFTRYRQDAVWAFISTGGFAASSAVAGVEYFNNRQNAGATTAIVNGQAVFVYQHHSLTGAYVFTGIATAFLFSTVIHFIGAAKHGRRAIEAYNRRFE